MAKSLLDELAGVLSPAELAKVRANQELLGRVSKQDELYGMYLDETIDPPAAIAEPEKKVEATSTTTDSRPGTSSSDIGKLLQSMSKLTEQIAGIDKVVATKVDEVVKVEGDKLVSAAVMRALKLADGLSKVREDWNANYGAEHGRFDSDKFEKWYEDQSKSGVTFGSIEKAYEQYSAPQREAANIENKVRERLKEKNSGAQVPGVTPTASSTLKTLMRRGRAEDSGGQTAVDRAGDKLNERLSGSVQ